MANKLSEKHAQKIWTMIHGPNAGNVIPEIVEVFDTLQAERDAEVGAVAVRAVKVIEEFDNLLVNDFEEAKWFDVKGKILALRTPAQSSALEADRARVHDEALEKAAKSVEERAADWQNVDIHAELINEAIAIRAMKLRAAAQPAEDKK